MSYLIVTKLGLFDKKKLVKFYSQGWYLFIIVESNKILSIEFLLMLYIVSTQ